MRESAFVTWCIQEAVSEGWLAYHVPAPMKFRGGSRKPIPEPRARGLCDLQLLHEDPARMILAECKNEEGDLSAEQRTYLRAARAVGDSIRTHLEAVREVLAAHAVDARELVSPARIPIGVYIWRPGMEDLITATLRSKVLPRC